MSICSAIDVLATVLPPLPRPAVNFLPNVDFLGSVGQTKERSQVKTSTWKFLKWFDNAAAGVLFQKTSKKVTSLTDRLECQT